MMEKYNLSFYWEEDVKEFIKNLRKDNPQELNNKINKLVKTLEVKRLIIK